VSLARDIVDRIFFPDRDVHAIPVLDGGFAPNQRLEDAALLGEFTLPDALALGPDGRLYISADKAILVCEGQRFQSRHVFAEVEASAGALAWSPSGVLFVAVAARGLQAFDAHGNKIGELTSAGDAPLRSITAVTVANDGTVFFVDGSRHNTSEQWLQDLMENRPGSGRLISSDANLRSAVVIADDLSWPAGVAMSRDQRDILVTEAWAHRLSAISRSGHERRMLVRNFAGYPARITGDGEGGYWVAFFALRTQLTEFVLREDRFRAKMMQKVPPPLWIGPSLGGHFDYREPTQIGRIKKLGIQKPWAPARSYGLVARLDATGYARESLHSRAAGTVHGTTFALAHRDEILVVAKGHGKLVAASLAREA
jgi:hypothetical protein